MEFLHEYLIEEALVVVVALIILGKIFKETPNFKQWLIPYTLLIIGVIATVGMLGLSFDNVIQGVLVSGAAVFGHQLFKQGKKGLDE